mgnify:CR=1 FL=1
MVCFREVIEYPFYDIVLYESLINTLRILSTFSDISIRILESSL